MELLFQTAENQTLVQGVTCLTHECTAYAELTYTTVQIAYLLTVSQTKGLWKALLAQAKGLHSTVAYKCFQDAHKQDMKVAATSIISS